MIYIDVEQGTPEWKKARLDGITGTDIGAILGVNQYRSRQDIFTAKTLGEPDLQDNETMKWGRLLEPVIAHEWARQRNLEIEPGRFAKDGFVLGSPDFMVKDHKRGLEIKTAGYTQLKSYKEGRNPLSYEYQCRWYMMLFDYEQWSLSALVGGQRQFDFEFYRDKRIDQLMMDAATQFWDEVEKWRKANR